MQVLSSFGQSILCTVFITRPCVSMFRAIFSQVWSAAENIVPLLVQPLKFSLSFTGSIWTTCPSSINLCGQENECCFYRGLSQRPIKSRNLGWGVGYISTCKCNKIENCGLFLQKGTLSRKMNTGFQSENKNKADIYIAVSPCPVLSIGLMQLTYS